MSTIPYGRSIIKTFPDQTQLNRYMVEQILQGNLEYVFFSGNPHELSNKKACDYYEVDSAVAKNGKKWEETLKNIDTSYCVIQKQK
jgi:hypothetical protein